LRRKLTSQDVASLVAESSVAWRYTSLMAAIQRRHNCSPSTAQRGIRQAQAAGLLSCINARYTTPARRSTVSVDTIRERRFVDRRRMLELIGDKPWRYSDLLEVVQTNFDCSSWAARSNLRYATQYGYLAKRGARYQLTQLAHQQLADYGRLHGAEGFRFARFISGHPKRGLQR
jgi:hypothetical protein